MPTVACPHCTTAANFPIAANGKYRQCPKCGGRLLVEIETSKVANPAEPQFTTSAAPPVQARIPKVNVPHERSHAGIVIVAVLCFLVVCLGVAAISLIAKDTTKVIQSESPRLNRSLVQEYFRLNANDRNIEIVASSTDEAMVIGTPRTEGFLHDLRPAMIENVRARDRIGIRDIEFVIYDGKIQDYCDKHRPYERTTIAMRKHQDRYEKVIVRGACPKRAELLFLGLDASTLLEESLKMGRDEARQSGVKLLDDDAASKVAADGCYEAIGVVPGNYKIVITVDGQETSSKVLIPDRAKVVTINFTKK